MRKVLKKIWHSIPKAMMLLATAAMVLYSSLFLNLSYFGWAPEFLTVKEAKAVVTLRPSSDGNYTAWGPLGGGSHYVEVDEAVADGDTSYIEEASSGIRDSFNLPDGQIPSGANVTQIKIYAEAKNVHNSKDDTFKIFYRKDGADTDGATGHTPPNGSYATYSETWSGLSWDNTDIDGLEIGIVSNTHTGGAKLRVTQMYVEVTYYAITTLTTDSADYPNLGQTITIDSTVKNGTSATISGSTADYVIFIDSDSDNEPDAGETYITNGCGGSGSWSSGNYTHQWSVPDVAVEGTQSDQWTCDNSNFPENTTYVLWMKWYDGATTYDTAYTTFTSVPTLGWYLFIIAIGIVVFIAYKKGYLKIRRPVLQTKTSSLALNRKTFKVRDLGFGKKKVIDLRKMRKLRK